jgi:hypothetical protein
MFYLTLVRTKLKYASTVWNSTSTHASNLERIQRMFVALCQNRFLIHGLATNEDSLRLLKPHSLHDRRLHLNALFFISVYSGLKSRPSVLDITGVI